jgi:hypothetical protein
MARVCRIERFSGQATAIGISHTSGIDHLQAGITQERRHDQDSSRPEPFNLCNAALARFDTAHLRGTDQKPVGDLLGCPCLLGPERPQQGSELAAADCPGCIRRVLQSRPFLWASGCNAPGNGACGDSASQGRKWHLPMVFAKITIEAENQCPATQNPRLPCRTTPAPGTWLQSWLQFTTVRAMPGRYASQVTDVPGPARTADIRSFNPWVLGSSPRRPTHPDLGFPCAQLLSSAPGMGRGWPGYGRRVARQPRRGLAGDGRDVGGGAGG